ncbi:MAG TPA: lysophospholipid acyltransferase family protein [Patescibacteria group bacterium]|nr:lysophospholipid acyltransferase family protein [Patescibacteria group bacterium]
MVNRARIAFYWTIKTIAWPVTHGYVRLRVLGSGNVPRKGPCIVVANHTSFVDAIVLGSACPRRITFLITRPIYSMWRLRWFYYMMGSIPVAPEVPDPGALKAAFRTLHRGDVVGIFPEGQRMADGNLGEGKAGVALIAARSGVPVVPAAIIGAHRVMPVGAMLPRIHPVRVVFGEQIRFPAVEGRRPSRQQVDVFADQVMKAIADLIAAGAPETGRDRGLRTTST